MTVTRASRPLAARTSRATVLFADLRGYTGLAERLEPARIVPLLDEFFGVLASATALHGGRVFHMAGDGMMAGFGVLEPEQTGAREALARGSRHAAGLCLDRGALAPRSVGRGRHRRRVASGRGGARAAWPSGTQADHAGRRYRQRRCPAVQPRARRRGSVVLYRRRRARGRGAAGGTPSSR